MRRVVITGVGAVTPVGHSIDETWSAVLAGKSGLGPITHFDASTFPTRIAGEVKGLDFWSRWSSAGLDYPMPRTVSVTSRLAIMAGLEAWKNSGLAEGLFDPTRAGVYIGAGKGESLGDLEFLGGFIQKCLNAEGSVDLKRFASEITRGYDPQTEIEVEPGRAMVHLAEMFGLLGPTSTCLTACAAGAQAIGEAFHAIRSGEADVMIAGGCHSMINPQSIMGFCLLGALSTDNDRPTQASRPFDKTRNGFVLSEGAALLVVEELDHARARGATIIGELAGYGCSCDAFRVTDPHPEGLGQSRAIRLALQSARMDPTEVGYVNAHGTSTVGNDEAETYAIKAVLGDHAYSVPVSSTKSMTGHLIAAAGSLETIFCALAIRDGVVPPTINYREKDPECDLDYVPNEARKSPVRAAITNSFGFGGQNTTLALRAL